MTEVGLSLSEALFSSKNTAVWSKTRSGAQLWRSLMPKLLVRWSLIYGAALVMFSLELSLYALSRSPRWSHCGR